MADHIQLLPDSLANQIAAGEVVQRPCSVVKELMENAIDAGADSIQLILNNAGKTLIQVVDNGRGMSEFDARLCFERHATSKIRNADDLFSIKTMGFRGEALASIAAVAKVELETKYEFDEIGTKVRVEASTFKSQEPSGLAKGSSISVRNLFYNVPARLKFLKSDNTEFRHIMDEFTRIVLAYPQVQFSLYHNGKENYRLVKGTRRQRIVSLFGKTMNERLVPVEEDLDDFFIDGFVTKPEGAKKAREQYLFVNSRFIKSPYLNHAVRTAYEDIIPSDLHPPFFLFIQINPAKVDINVHPTKQEIKFEEERLIYNYVKLAVRHALGKYHITPSLDFNAENKITSAGVQSRGGFTRLDPIQRKNLEQWNQIYEGMISVEPETQATEITISSGIGQPMEQSSEMFSDDTEQASPYLLHGKYILLPIKSGFMVIDQRAARERILFEQLKEKLKQAERSSQKILFPESIELSMKQSEVFAEVHDAFWQIGFEIESFGKQSVIVHGIPAILTEQKNMYTLIVDLLDAYAEEKDSQDVPSIELAKAIAKSISGQKRSSLSVEEMRNLVDQLFGCEIPFRTPSGKNCFISIDLDELKNRFNR